MKALFSPNINRYSNKDFYIRSGNSGILLPRISLGLWKNFGSTSDYANAKSMVEFAFDNGIVHFDLANNYGPDYGTAETNFGKIIKDSLSNYRDELFISTKAGYDMWEGPYGNWGSRKYLISSLNQSLKRMNLDYVDIFYSHRYDPLTPIEETLQALVDIVKQGKSLYIGISRYPLKEAQFAYNYLAERDVKCLLYQGKYNLLNKEAQTSGIIDNAAKNGVGFIAFSPLAQGLLTDKYFNGIPSSSRMALNTNLKIDDLTPDLLLKLKELNNIATQRGQTLSQMSLSWILSNKNVTSIIIGASSKDQIKQNLNSVTNIEFTTEELSLINNILVS
jgi:Predicted oxidoreductases (related to aryl-alcohol dehydrogenases)